MQKRTLNQIKKALEELSEKGWIKSNRSHNTGIGKTLEDNLDITENNIALPDFGVMELKSQRPPVKSWRWEMFFAPRSPETMPTQWLLLLARMSKETLSARI
jgi:hypothetical protein